MRPEAQTPVRSDAQNGSAVLLSGRRSERDRLRVLVELLNDDSPSVFSTVRDELERAGRRALPALGRAARSPHARLRARARNVLASLDRRAAMRRLLRYASRSEIDLERALLLLGRLDQPRLDPRPYVKALDAMASEVARRAAREQDTLSRPMVLSHYLGNELGFIGSEADFDHPQNVHLHRAIERKRGMPLTLVAIYLFVARRVGFRAAAVALPGRVLLRLYAGRRSLLIDPFLGGRIRTKTDCIRYLAKNGLVPRPEWFRDASDPLLFQRHVLNLMGSSQMRGLVRESRELHELARVIARTREPATAR